MLPQKPGQAKQMTICAGPDTIEEEVGHWYSPEAVSELLTKNCKQCRLDIFKFTAWKIVVMGIAGFVFGFIAGSS